jgi:AcrR family transcriptional regulator
MRVRSTVLQDEEPAGLSTNQAARRQRIVDTALSLLGGREYERIQVKDVADGASVALGTVYHYFSSKEQLFGEVLVQWAATLGANISRRSLAGVDPASRLEDALHRSVQAFERRPQLAKLVARLEVSEDPFASDVLNRLDATTNQVYLTALQGLEPEKALRVVRVADAVLDSSLRAWSAGRLPIKEVYRSLSDVVALLLPAD